MIVVAYEWYGIIDELLKIQLRKRYNRCVNSIIMLIFEEN